TSCPTTPTPPGTGTTPATRKTTAYQHHPPGDPHRSRTGTTSPAPGSTAGAPAAGPTGTPTSPPPPRGGWCVPIPHNPARPACRAPHPRDPAARVLDPL